MSIIQAPPTRVPAVDKSGFFQREWRNWLLTIQNSTQASAQILQEASVPTQTATIPTTPLALPSISAGFYRVNVYILVTQAAGISGSAAVTIGWTDGGLICTRVIASPANTTGANAGTSFPIHVDDASPITYAVAYASNPPSAFTYNLGVIAEQLA